MHCENLASKDSGLVSVIIPTKNEEDYISKCIESLESSDYPNEKLELMIVDGGSTDKTIEMIENLQRKHHNIRLIRNNGANTSVGRNIGVKNSAGDIVFNFSSHALVEKETIRVLATKLCNSPNEVVGVGCKDKIPMDQSSNIAIGIDSITSTVLGGTLMHQQVILKEERYSDSISFTVYRKKIFEEIGFFNPAFPAGDDAEFNLRIRRAGYKLLFTPVTCVYRYRRERLKKFFWQMFHYGKTRMQINKTYNYSVRLAYVIPLLFIAYFFAFIGLLFISNLTLIIGWSLGVFTYFFVLLVFSIKISFSKKKPNLFVLCPLLYLAEHFGYGLGLLAGAASFKQV